MNDLRTAVPGDEPAVERFLARHAETSMFLRSNLRAAGVVDEGRSLQGTWAVGWRDGAVTGVATHCWNGILLLQAPERLPELARAAIAGSGRTIRGLIGPLPQVEAARGELGLEVAATALDDREILFSLDLEALRIPALLASEGVRCRRPRADELPLLGEWRAAYAIETLGAGDGPDLRAASHREIEASHAAGSHWVLEQDGETVAYSAFNARLPDMVQIGGVYTPPELRGRGYARAVVAGSLRDWAAEPGEPGSRRRAILFTGQENLPAQRAYEALGFRRIGEYGVVLFA